MKNGSIQKLIFPLLVIIAVTGCKKDPLNNLSDDESRIYITNYDKEADFSSYQTFSISDSIAVIENNQLSGHALTAWDIAFREAFVQNMVNRGYVQVDKSNTPDLGINLSRIYNTYTGVIDYSRYWNNYYGYYDPYYWGYPGYSYYFPPMYGLYEVNEGAASVDILDLKNSSENNQITGIWNGLLRGTGVFSTEKIQQQVNALFEQSPYLQR